MKIYLDNCAFNRPFDDQRNSVVFAETVAKLVVQQMVKERKLELLWSDVLEYENNDNPFEERRAKIAEWEAYASGTVEMSDAIIEKARGYVKIGLRQKDASHIACAVGGGGDYFITVDKKILNKPICEIAVVDPVAFLRRVQNVD